MVFSSIPSCLDPSNWQQQPNHHQVIGSGGLPPPPPHGSIRPGSMAERARMNNIPLPDPALKCPRCHSPNTKFCYFNNYSLSQPRYYCKDCRRYWTNGGTLRNVPVGGGCRRNKRKSSKSPANGNRQTTTTPTATTSATTDQNYYNNILGLPPPRFLSPLPQFADSFSGDQGYISAPASSEMNLPGNFLGGGQIMMSDGGGNIEGWRLQPQFPFLGGMDGTFQFQGEASAFMGGAQRPKLLSPELNLSRELLGGLLPAGNESNNNNNNNSNAANWSGLASFSCSSKSNGL